MSRGFAMAAIIACSSLLFSSIARADFDYPNFSSIAGLNLVGDAAQSGDRLRLTPAAEFQKGAAWFTQKQAVESGFTTTFEFQLPDLPGQADGLALVLQNSSVSAIGGWGGGMAYATAQDAPGIANSLAIEFDTWDNGEWPDLPASHVSVQTRGTDPNSADHTFSIGATDAIPSILDGAAHIARITYESGSLTVFVDDLVTPVLTVAVDLSSTLTLDQGTAWVGLGSATGSRINTHDALSWAFTEGVSPSIPAVSEWGLVAMALLGLVVGTVMFRGRRAVA